MAGEPRMPKSTNEAWGRAVIALERIAASLAKLVTNSNDVANELADIKNSVTHPGGGSS